MNVLNQQHVYLDSFWKLVDFLFEQIDKAYNSCYLYFSYVVGIDNSIRGVIEFILRLTDDKAERIKVLYDISNNAGENKETLCR
jgi:hypothetical protein